MPEESSAVLQLNATNATINSDCQLDAYCRFVKYSHTINRDTSDANPDNDIIQGTFPGKPGLSLQTMESSNGYSGGYLVSAGSHGRLIIRYPCPVASALAVTA